MENRVHVEPVDDEPMDIRLRDVSMLIQQCPEEFLVLTQSDLEKRQGVADAV